MPGRPVGEPCALCRHGFGDTATVPGDLGGGVGLLTHRADHRASLLRFCPRCVQERRRRK